MVDAAIIEPPLGAVIEDEAWERTLGCEPQTLLTAVGEALSAELGLNLLAASVSFSTDAAVAQLNGAYRGKPAPTNVLAFPAPAHVSFYSSHRGDVALARETVEREAAEQGKTMRDHTAHLITHGLLHLMGYDHETEADAEAMERIERAVLARLGVGDPYE